MSKANKNTIHNQMNNDEFLKITKEMNKWYLDKLYDKAVATQKRNSLQKV